MSTSTQVSQLKINKLTKDQYSSISPSDTELYFVLDEDESSLPPQEGEAGKFLTTDGTTPAWETVMTDGANTQLDNLSEIGNSRLQYIPFSINNGEINSFGENKTLSPSVDNTSINCLACTITTIKGEIFTDETVKSQNLSNFSNGTYYVFKSAIDGSLTFTDTFEISKTTPETPSSGEIWFNYSNVPSELSKRESNSWTSVNDLVYIGTITVESGLCTNVINREYNSEFDINPKLHQIYPIVETYSNGTNWYRVYSDSWCEQGGETSNVSNGTVEFMKPFANTNYNLILTPHRSGNSASASVWFDDESISTDSFKFYGNNLTGVYWRASGFIPLEVRYQ